MALPHIAFPLGVGHTKPVASRFSPGYQLAPTDQFEMLYLAEDPMTALYEVGSMLGNPFKPGKSVANKLMSFATLSIQVSLSRVADISDVLSQLVLDTTVQELTGEWESYQVRFPGVTSVAAPTGIAPTQELGWHMFKAGLEGFRATSAKVSTMHNLILFPGNFDSSSYIEFYDTIQHAKITMGSRPK